MDRVGTVAGGAGLDALMRYLSLFSGIEAASVAWLPLGWTCVGVAEIDPFPCAVLAHHYPDVPNLGSVVDITDAQIAALGPIDIVVGGSPCQDLSVAGTRAGLAGERSGLFHQQLRIFHAARHFCGARFLLWENVPGAFSSNRGLDFAVVAGAMAGCRLPVPEIGWGTEGVALGEHGLLEWAVLDAQWFGLAQRRRRVFALLDAGDWANRPPILLEPDKLRGDSPPRRKAGQVAPTIPTRRAGVGGLGTDCDGGLIHAPEVARCVETREGSSQDFETTTMIAHAFDARQSDVIQYGDKSGPIDTDGHSIGVLAEHYSHDYCQDRIYSSSGIAPALDCAQGVAGALLAPVAFSCKDYGGDAGPISPTLRSMGHDGSHANAGGQVAVAFIARQDPDHWHDRTGPLDTDGSTQAVSYAIQAGALRTNPASGPDGVGVQADHAYTLEARAEVQAVAFQERGRKDGRSLEVGGDVAYALTSPCGGGRAQERNVLTPTMQVRRLTPTECARLQGFPDDYLDITYRGKPAADGPKYKALGNSWAVPCVTWIGRRIAASLE